MTKMKKNGISTTTQLGSERYEIHEMCGRTRIMYDYRTENGRLFSCIKNSLEECRKARDKWLAE